MFSVHPCLLSVCHGQVVLCSQSILVLCQSAMDRWFYVLSPSLSLVSLPWTGGFMFSVHPCLLSVCHGQVVLCSQSILVCCQSAMDRWFYVLSPSLSVVSLPWTGGFMFSVHPCLLSVCHGQVVLCSQSILVRCQSAMDRWFYVLSPSLSVVSLPWTGGFMFSVHPLSVVSLPWTGGFMFSVHPCLLSVCHGQVVLCSQSILVCCKSAMDRWFYVLSPSLSVVSLPWTGGFMFSVHPCLLSVCHGQVVLCSQSILVCCQSAMDRWFYVLSPSLSVVSLPWTGGFMFSVHPCLLSVCHGQVVLCSQSILVCCQSAMDRWFYVLSPSLSVVSLPWTGGFMFSVHPCLLSVCHGQVVLCSQSIPWDQEGCCRCYATSPAASIATSPTVSHCDTCCVSHCDNYWTSLTVNRSVSHCDNYWTSLTVNCSVSHCDNYWTSLTINCCVSHCDN